MNTIGNLIKEAREKKKMDREELAKKIKISTSYLGHIERDDLVRVSMELAKALQKALKVNVAPLIDQHNVHVMRQVRQWNKARSA